VNPGDLGFLNGNCVYQEASARCVHKNRAGKSCVMYPIGVLSDCRLRQSKHLSTGTENIRVSVIKSIHR